MIWKLYNFESEIEYISKIMYDCNITDQVVVNLPKHWETMPSGISCQSFTVLPESPEYNEVRQLFKATVQRNVIKVHWIGQG